MNLCLSVLDAGTIHLCVTHEIGATVSKDDNCKKKKDKNGFDD